MNRRAPLITSAVAIAAAAVALGAPAMAGPPPGPHGPAGQTIYSSVPSPLPANLPGEGPEAYSFNQFGDRVDFVGAARELTNVTLTLSDWACENGHWYLTDAGACSTTPGTGFSLPITFTVYQAGAGNSVGPEIASDIENVFVPYRPSSGGCADATRWYDSATGTCNHGLATNVSFDFSGQSVMLPNEVVYGVTFNTTHFGPSPIGESSCNTSADGCDYDSLNIALAPQVYVGSQSDPGTVYQNSPYGSEYCDGGTAGTGTFRLDSPSSQCWTGYVPAVAFHADIPNATCTGTLPAGTYKDVVVPAGASCMLNSDVTVMHDVNVQHGGSLLDRGATIGHDLRADKPASIGLYYYPSVGHDISINGVTGGTSNGAVAGDNYICSTTVGHDLTVQNSDAGAGQWFIGAGPECTYSNNIGHDLRVQNNDNAVHVSGNNVGHDANCNKNASQDGSGNQAGNKDTCNSI